MKQEAVRGHLDALILAVVEDEPLHGYAVIEALADRSAGELALSTGTVYPALRRLEAAGLLRSRWSTVGGRRRRTYRLTAAGERALQDERVAWRGFTTVIEGVLLPSGGAALQGS